MPTHTHTCTDAYTRSHSHCTRSPEAANLLLRHWRQRSGAELLSSIAQPVPARTQPPAEQPAAPGGGAGGGGAGRESTRSRAWAHPASRLACPGTGAPARRGTIWSADASKTSNGPKKRGRVGTFPLPGGARAPGVPWPGGARTHLGHGTAPCRPAPSRPRPLGPAVLQLEPGSDAAGCAAPRPALPAPPNQPLSKGWSSKIFSRAPSVYHTVNLGFQQLYDAAGRWERTKRCSAFVRHSPHVPVPPALGPEGTDPRFGLRGG